MSHLLKWPILFSFYLFSNVFAVETYELAQIAEIQSLYYTNEISLNENGELEVTPYAENVLFQNEFMQDIEDKDYYSTISKIVNNADAPINSPVEGLNFFL